MNTWLSILPPLAAILLAVITRRVLLSLSVGIGLGAVLLYGLDPLAWLSGTTRLFLDVIADPGNARMLLFGLLIGAVVFLVQRSGGVAGFVALVSKPGRVDSPRKAGLLTAFLGIGLFLEGSMSILTVGTVAKPLFERFKISREKLAYVADSTCAPVAVLIPLNGWGAYLMTQFQSQGIESGFSLLWQSLPFFFYPMLALSFVFIAVIWNWDLGAMKKVEEVQRHESFFGADEKTIPSLGLDESNKLSTQPYWINKDSNGAAQLAPELSFSSAKAGNFVWPMIVMIASLFAFMLVTGGGNITAGDGGKSILCATMLTVLFCFVLYRAGGTMNTGPFLRACIDGMRHLSGVVMILALAFTINAVCRELETGRYVAGLVDERMPVFMLPALIFLVSAVIAFATGTSWGTFAIMLGIGFPMAAALNLPLPLVVGAIVSGGVWGDHCSPISDTTVLSALASDCPLMDHVRTQLPYALLGGALSFLAFLLAGVLLIS